MVTGERSAYSSQQTDSKSTGLSVPTHN